MVPNPFRDYQIHDHAGARWLAPFIAVFALTLVMAFMMLVYPHITG